MAFVATSNNNFYRANGKSFYLGVSPNADRRFKSRQSEISLDYRESGTGVSNGWLDAKMVSPDVSEGVNNFSSNRNSTPDSSNRPSTQYNKSSTTRSSISTGISFLGMDAATKPQSWRADVSELISTEDWLKKFGLHVNKLDMNGILQQIGFRHADGFDDKLRMPVCSRYGTDLFLKYFKSNGNSYNIISNMSALQGIESRLTNTLSLYKQRMNWLTSESRETFGVIQENSILLVADFKPMTRQQFDLSAHVLQSVLQQQISAIEKFNIIRSAEDPALFNDQQVPVNKGSINAAIQWVRSLNPEAQVTSTSLCEALHKAAGMTEVEAVYLFIEGSTLDCQELVRGKIRDFKIPVHVVSFNCTSSDTIRYLKSLAELTNARFHAYTVNAELDVFEHTPGDDPSSLVSIGMRRKQYGGTPAGVGVRQDVHRLFVEMEEARDILENIRSLLEDQSLLNKRKSGPDADTIKAATGSVHPVPSGKDELSMISSEWLQYHGLRANRLDLFDALSAVVFKHADGLIDLHMAPDESDICVANARTVRKSVEAKYCNKFGHIKWRDGQLVHVHVTSEFLRQYTKRLDVVLNNIRDRIAWLQRGSREIFGTVAEAEVCLLIDTSLSMSSHIEFVKEKIFQLMQEQLRLKQKFNIIAFNSNISTWKPSLTEVTEESLRSAWKWVKSLRCHGTTNVEEALKCALNDSSTQAVYMLTDGRPDQPPESLISKARRPKKIPIHTISFNCDDREANEFLYELSKQTGARYHRYPQSGSGSDDDGVQPWRSEDITVLRQEMALGKENLAVIERLREECERSNIAPRPPSGLLRHNTTRPTQRHKRKSVNKSTQRKTKLRIGYRHMEVSDSLPSFPSPKRPDSAPGFLGTLLRQSETSPIPSRNIRSASLPTGNTCTGDTVVVSHKEQSELGEVLVSPRGDGNVSPNIEREVSSNKEKLTTNVVSTGLDRKEAAENEQEDRSNDDKEKSKETTAGSDTEKSNPMGSQKTTGAIAVKAEEGKRDKKKKKQHLLEGYQSSRRWLKQQGLEAMNLTLIDLLGPAIVHQPISNGPGHKKRLIRLTKPPLNLDYLKVVKHVAVMQNEYENKITTAIKKFQRRLDLIVWTALTPAERKVYKSNKPVSFIDNRLSLMESLERSGWRILESDIALIEREIATAHSYIELARDIVSKATKISNKTSKELIDKETDDNKKTSGDGKQASGASERNNKKENSGQGEKKSKSRENSPTDESSKERKFHPRPCEQKNLRVVARFNEDGYYYPGRVECCVNHRLCVIKFDWRGLEDHEVSINYIIPISGAIARPDVKNCSYVLCCVRNADEPEALFYAPGRVIGLPVRSNEQPRFYSIRLFSGKTIELQRQHMILISKERYQRTVDYIQRIHDLDWGYKNEETGTQTDRETVVQTSRERETFVQTNRETVVQTDKERPRRERRESADINPAALELLRRLRETLRKQIKLKEATWHELDKIRQLRNIQETPREDPRQKVKNDQESESESYQSEHNGDQTNLSQLLRLRRTLGVIKINEEVLARFAEDGWFYTGVVIEDFGDNGYLVKDCMGDSERIWREAIVTDEDNCRISLRVGDCIIARHPRYKNSYCPGRVVSMRGDTVHFELYDGTEGKDIRGDVYAIAPSQYSYTVNYIKHCEDKWISSPMIGYNETKKAFELGEVVKRVNPSTLRVKWLNDSEANVDSTLVFGPYNRRRPISNGSYVLGPIDRLNSKYMPGRVTRGKSSQLTVEYCDGFSVSDVEPSSCFNLSEEFYKRFVSLVMPPKAKEDINLVMPPKAKEDINLVMPPKAKEDDENDNNGEGDANLVKRTNAPKPEQFEPDNVPGARRRKAASSQGSDYDFHDGDETSSDEHITDTENELSESSSESSSDGGR